MTSNRVWYMAHPIAPDERYTFQQNMDHVVHLTRLCLDEGLLVIAPYHTHCLALDDTIPEHRQLGLETDLRVVEKIGRLISVGHKISPGIKKELEIVRKYGGIYWDCTGLTDGELRDEIRSALR